MKYFFTSAIAASNGGEAHSAEAVRHRIKQLIEAEPPHQVLSDDSIVEKLREAGIEIRLEGHGAAADKPGAVLLLCAEQVLQALLIDFIGDGQSGGVQSHQRAACGECRARSW